MSEPLVLINLFTIPADKVDAFIARWEKSTTANASSPGFRGTRLHRAIDPDAQYPLINIARWESVEEWQAFSAQFAGGPPAGTDAPQDYDAETFSASPALYTVVSSLPDPQDPAA